MISLNHRQLNLQQTPHQPHQTLTPTTVSALPPARTPKNARMVKDRQSGY